MKNLVFRKLSLISYQEKKGRSFTFSTTNPTIIIGKNDTGKSSVLKSLYYTFGAEPGFHTKWVGAKIKSAVEFEIDQKSYTIVRDGSLIALFDDKKKLIKTFTSVTKELAPYFSELFNFKLQYIAQNNQIITPPPAYIFLPFYVDQDRGWGENWNSFQKLTQLSGQWVKDLVDYHTGIKGNEFYKLKSDIDTLRQSRDELANELKFKTMIKNEFLKSKPDKLRTALPDDKEIRAEISRLTDQNQRIALKISKVSKSIVELQNERHNLVSEIHLAEHAIKELKSDYEVSTAQIFNDVVCPTCGAEYENNFRERYNIKYNEAQCYDIKLTLEQKKITIDKEVSELSVQLQNLSDEQNSLNSEIALNEQKISFTELVENEADRRIKTILSENTLSTSEKLEKIEEDIKHLKKEQSEYLDKERQEQILDYYFRTMKQYLQSLDVHNIEEKTYQQIHSKIRETGSDLPRSLLAYYFSILKVMREYSTSIFCPVVIDSPNQQEQDNQNAHIIYEFIKKNMPAKSQLILGTVNTQRVRFGGKIINLSKKWSVLLPKEFPKIDNYFRHLLEQTITE